MKKMCLLLLLACFFLSTSTSAHVEHVYSVSRPFLSPRRTDRPFKLCINEPFFDDVILFRVYYYLFLFPRIEINVLKRSAEWSMNEMSPEGGLAC
jgi:hypothetical protein